MKNVRKNSMEKTVGASAPAVRRRTAAVVPLSAGGRSRDSKRIDRCKHRKQAV